MATLDSLFEIFHFYHVVHLQTRGDSEFAFKFTLTVSTQQAKLYQGLRSKRFNVYQSIATILMPEQKQILADYMEDKAGPFENSDDEFAFSDRTLEEDGSVPWRESVCSAGIYDGFAGSAVSV